VNLLVWVFAVPYAAFLSVFSVVWVFGNDVAIFAELFSIELFNEKLIYIFVYLTSHQ
jgi:hypothetical protein